MNNIMKINLPDFQLDMTKTFISGIESTNEGISPIVYSLSNASALRTDNDDCEGFETFKYGSPLKCTAILAEYMNSHLVLFPGKPQKIFKAYKDQPQKFLPLLGEIVDWLDLGDSHGTAGMIMKKMVGDFVNMDIVPEGNILYMDKKSERTPYLFFEEECDSEDSLKNELLYGLDYHIKHGGSAIIGSNKWFFFH